MSEAQVEKVIPIEFFRAVGGKSFMAVPTKCGLKEADTLLISGKRMAAMKDNVILDLRLPNLTDKAVELLKGMVDKKERLTVGEFLDVGNADAYFLNLKFAN